MGLSTPTRYPDSSVFYRDLTRSFPVVVEGKGCYLIDDQGKRYLDACGGAYVANLGHGVQEIADAVGAQAARIAYVNGTAFTTEVAEKLAVEMAELCPKPLDHDWKVYFLSSGSEAVEAVLKLARHYWVELGRPNKHKIIALSPGYHGNTLLALSASARGHYKKLYQPWLFDVITIAAPYPYRCACRGAGNCPACTAALLEEAIVAAGPDHVAAFIAEPVGGSSTGASVPPHDYFRRVREICDRYQVLWIADEVLTGAGRTGKWLATEHFGVVPDMITMGKGISGGYVALSAVLAPKRIVEPIAAGSGALKHSQTFSHSPMGCAAGLAAVHYLKHHKLVERANTMGKLLHQRLQSLSEVSGVGDVRGIGMLGCVEFVQDKGTRAPYPRDLKIAETLVRNAQDMGLILWPGIGHAGQDAGDLVMIAPPFVINEAEIEELVTLFRQAIETTIGAL